ncbi:MAG TPA: branched-chain amino acid ABC transporter permease [Desulfomonilaceae bacterium]|nr:branched-chain amino acid ABC transporter permease [Desulfomonilaceae bacterium]HVN82247.1 branched-chain amino acid ABC transporter permease [Terriglobia bacterium]
MNPRVPIWLKWALGAAALIALPLVVRDRYFLHLLVTAGIFVLLASSWNLLAGYAGQLNLGHAAFYGIGAYTSAILATKLGITPWLGLFAGGFVSALFGLMLGVPSLRLSGPYLAITTIGFSEILRLVAMNWVQLTRGSLGLYGIPPFTPIRLGSWLEIQFRSEISCYYLLLVLVCASLVIFRRLIRSEFGLSLESLREDEIGAASIGVNISGYKLAVFTISAFFAGLAGAFFAHYQRLVSPDTLSLGETFTILTMTMLGGLGTLLGPVVGAVLLTFLSEGLRFLEDMVKLDVRMIIYGVLLIVTILFMRGGIVGLLNSLRGTGRAKD